MTDVICIVIGVIFGLILFIMAVVMFDRSNLERTSYPADSTGNICQL